MSSEASVGPAAADATAQAPDAAASSEPSSAESPARVDAVAQSAPDREPAPAGAAPTREKRRGLGWGALIAASLLGGIVGAGLTYAAQMRLGSPVQRFGERVARLEARPEARPSAPERPDGLPAAERRLATLETDQKALSDRVSSAEQAAEAASKRAQEALSPAAPASAAAPAPDDAALDQLGGRVAALEAELRNRAQAAPQMSQAVERRLAAQDERLAAVAKQIAGQEQDQRLADLAKQLQAQDQRLAGVAKQLQDQDQRLGAVAKQVQERGPEAATLGLRVILADRLAGALREGAPFSEALAAQRRFNADPARLAALEPFAASGAPTTAALLQEFRPLGQRILAEARPAASSWSDRLRRIADSIVSVRPVGEAGSTTVPGIVGRIESALERGAIQDAAAAWDSLPEPARRTSEEFGRRLKQRAAADEAARKLSAEALSALDASTR